MSANGCGAPVQSAPLPGAIDVEKETILSGQVFSVGNEPVVGAYVRLLDRTGEFTAEVVTGEGGVFRFFAAEGDWTLRALSRDGDGETKIAATRGLNEVSVSVARS